MSSGTQSTAEKKALINKDIFQSTLSSLDNGSYAVKEVGEIPLKDAVARCVKGTILYDAESVLSNWNNPASADGEAGASGVSESAGQTKGRCEITMQNMTTLAVARLLESLGSSKENSGAFELERKENKIGILNFADAKMPGGLVVEGASAQEESIVRTSTLYRSLTSEIAEPFYTLHKKGAQGEFYTHTVIYSPNTLLLRDDEGTWLTPLCVDIVSSAPVNALGVPPQESATEKVASTMRERAARSLYAFELNGVRQIVLGAYGCGKFGGDVRTIAGIWADLLGRKESRFKGSFDRVMFAILAKDLYENFKDAYESRCVEEGSI